MASLAEQVAHHELLAVRAVPDVGAQRALRHFFDRRRDGRCRHRDRRRRGWRDSRPSRGRPCAGSLRSSPTRAWRKGRTASGRAWSARSSWVRSVRRDARILHSRLAPAFSSALRAGWPWRRASAPRDGRPRAPDSPPASANRLRRAQLPAAGRLRRAQLRPARQRRPPLRLYPGVPVAAAAVGSAMLDDSPAAAGCGRSQLEFALSCSRAAGTIGERDQARRRRSCRRGGSSAARVPAPARA